MRMRIDEAGQYQLAGHVDHLSGAGRQNVALHSRDLAIADGDVPDPVDAGGRTDHAAAAQKLVEGGADRHEQSPLSSPAALLAPSPEYEAYFVFYKSKLHAMIARGEAHRIELLASMFRGWGECVAESKRASWRDQTSPVATVRTTGLSDPPAASDSRRAVPGSVRKIRGDAAAIQPAFGACGTENRRSDHVGGRYRAGQDDDDRSAQAAGRPQFCREGRR